MTQSFSILSYNIQAGIGTQRASHYLTRAHNQFVSTKAKRTRLRAIGKFVAGFDVVCLQEVDLGGRRAGFENQVNLVQAASGHPHAVFQENRIVRRISRHGNAILSRAAILSCEDIKLPGRLGGRGALIAELDMEPATTVACVHLSLGAEDQTEQLEHLADYLGVAGRIIVCGDLNCGPGASPINVFAERTELRPVTTVGHKTYPSWAPRAALDHILTNRPRQAVDVTVEAADHSDHRPVSAEFPVQILRR